MKRIKNGMIAALLCVVINLLLCPTAWAANTVDLNAKCVLTVEFTYEHEPIEGAEFQLYRVADMDAKQNLTLIGIFADMVMDLDDLSGTALQLYARVNGTAAEADVSFTTDELGLGSAEDLRPGAYLMVGQPTTQGERTHYVDPQLIICPHQRSEDGQLSYYLTIRPKSTDVPTDIKLTEITVVKVWKDEGYESERPTSITARLLKNGKTVSTVILSEANQWTHTWSDLLPNAEWSVEEDVPEGYVANVEEWDDVFTLTNYRKDIDQTGQIWWPVAVLACAGFAMIVAGIILRRSVKNEA